MSNVICLISKISQCVKKRDCIDNSRLTKSVKMYL